MNGTGPPVKLKESDYNAVKDGTCITSGTYKGCIKVKSVCHWFKDEEGKDNWVRYTGVPSDHAEMTDDVWDLCKYGGDYEYNSEVEGFVYNDDSYRWKPEDGDIVLAEV
jgi:hypothetical protein